MCVCVSVCINIKILTSIGYSDLLFVSLARMRGKNSFGLALNQSVIIVFIAMNVAADARHLFQGATNISFPQVNFIQRARTDCEYRVSVQGVECCE